MQTKTFSVPVQVTAVEESQHPDFLRIDLKAIAEGRNVNKSSFTLDSMHLAIGTVYNKPVLAYYSDIKNDTEGHNVSEKKDYNTGEWYMDFNTHNSEKPVGTIPQDAEVSIQNIEGKNWLVIKGALIWKEYNYKLVNLLRKQRRKSVSVEVQVESSEIDKDGYEIIHQFRLLGVTILGNAVKPGIPGASLDLVSFANSDGFQKYAHALTFAYQHGSKVEDIDQQQEGGDNKTHMEQFVSKDELGKGKTLQISESKESLSKDPWGEVNKSELKQNCLKSSNYKSICPKVFMKLEDGWEDGKEGALKYPVMQLKGNTLVYNKYGLSSAMAYAQKEGESDVLKKVKAIRKKLGIDKEDEQMQKKYAELGYTLLSADDKYAVVMKDFQLFAAPVEDDEEKEGEDKKDFAETLKPLSIKMESADEENKLVFELSLNQYFESETKKFEENMETERKTMEENKKAMEEEKAQMQVRMTALEEEKKTMEAQIEDMRCHAAKMEEEKKMAEEKLAKYEAEAEAKKFEALKMESETLMEQQEFAAEDKEEVLKMVEDKKFSTFEEVKNEIGRRIGLRQMEDKESKAGKRQFKQNLETQRETQKPNNVFDVLKTTIVNKK